MEVVGLQQLATSAQPDLGEHIADVAVAVQWLEHAKKNVQCQIHVKILLAILPDESDEYTGDGM